MKSAYAALSRLDENPPEIISELRALEAQLRGVIYFRMLIPEEAAPQFRDDVAPRNGMMPPPDSEMIAPPITE